MSVIGMFHRLRIAFEFAHERVNATSEANEANRPRVACWPTSRAALASFYIEIWSNSGRMSIASNLLTLQVTLGCDFLYQLLSSFSTDVQAHVRGKFRAKRNITSTQR